MPLLSSADRVFFKENGFLVKHNVLTEEQILKGREVIWENLESETDVDRNDPRTWVREGPRTPSGGQHPDIVGTLMDSPAFSMAEELVGKGKLKPPGFCGPALNYPTGKQNWTPPAPNGGHLDYHPPDEGRTGFTIGGMIYLDHVEARGGGFVVWPGSHIPAMRLFHEHADDLSGVTPESTGNIDLPSGPKIVSGPAGTVCLWHGNLVHNLSENGSNRIRLALIIRMRRFDWDETRNDFSGDIWKYWEGIISNE